MNLSTKPPKGTYDWMPDEYAIRKYIFDTWRRVCTQFGYEEYLTPLIEDAEIYRAKSGEDIGGKELTVFTDRGGRELAIRPEMTPSVTRMVAERYESMPKPIRLFSIANFFRNEKPQRGRNREFWQLNYDIFGVDTISADVEVIQVSLEVMLALNPPKDSFTLFINNRFLIDAILLDLKEDDKTKVVRVMDKWDKLDKEDIIFELSSLGLTNNQVAKINKFMDSKDAKSLLSSLPELEKNIGFQQIQEVIASLNRLGYSDWVKFQPNIIRGFDYYDGIVFEVFDNSKDNNRSLFGGGRYNGLASLFGKTSFPAVGCAPGDETLRLFLESWNLVEVARNSVKNDLIYIPILTSELEIEAQELAQKLRQEGKNVIVGLETQKLGKALEYADKKGFSQVIILGEDEAAEGIYKLKDMVSGEEEVVSS